MSRIYLTWDFIEAAFILNCTEFVNTFNRNLSWRRKQGRSCFSQISQKWRFVLSSFLKQFDHFFIFPAHFGEQKARGRWCILCATVPNDYSCTYLPAGKKTGRTSFSCYWDFFFPCKHGVARVSSEDSGLIYTKCPGGDKPSVNTSKQVFEELGTKCSHFQEISLGVLFLFLCCHTSLSFLSISRSLRGNIMYLPRWGDVYDNLYVSLWHQIKINPPVCPNSTPARPLSFWYF